MAGIGFNLQKMLHKDTFSSTIKAYFVSTLIVAGPWLLSIITIFVLSTYIPHHIDLFERTLFRVIIIYIFAFSLITIGIFHFPLNRYLADRLFVSETDAIVPTLNTSIFLVILFQGCLGAIFYFTTQGEVFIKILTVLIYMTISLIWVLMIFLTALRDYKAVAVAYTVGTVVAITVALLLGNSWGLEGYFIGYLLGQFIIIILWSSRIFIEFPSSRCFEAEFLKFLLRKRTLVLIGFFYNLAIWIDKIVMWLSPQAHNVTDFFRTHLVYDTATFFAFLTIIPALSIFLVQVETNFYHQYRRYFLSVVEKATMPQILRIHKDMTASLRTGLSTILRYQGIVTVVCIVYAPELAKMFGFSAMQIPVFRVSVLAAFLHGMILLNLIIILYFDFQSSALFICCLFVVLNGVLTFITTGMDTAFLGFGYLVASFITLFISFMILNRKLERLEYYTFAMQPVGVHREEEIR